MANMEWRFLTQSQIDKAKWDQCVESAWNENPMGYSWFLDVMCPNWHGLVFGDYEAVMPIELEKKAWVIKSSHSAYVQFQGVYTNNCELKISLHDIIQLALRRRWYRFVFCETPGFSAIVSPTSIERTSYVLKLDDPYHIIEKNYDAGHRKNLRRAQKQDVVIKTVADASLFTMLKNQMTDNRQIKQVPVQTSRRMEKLIDIALKQGYGEFYAAYTGAEFPDAVAFFLKGKKRAIIFSASNNKGRDSKATFALVDGFIQRHSASGLMLDFAGSSIKGIADFNKGFGAMPLSYNRIEVSTIPKLFEKLF